MIMFLKDQPRSRRWLALLAVVPLAIASWLWSSRSSRTPSAPLPPVLRSIETGEPGARPLAFDSSGRQLLVALTPRKLSLLNVDTGTLTPYAHTDRNVVDAHFDLWGQRFVLHAFEMQEFPNGGFRPHNSVAAAGPANRVGPWATIPGLTVLRKELETYPDGTLELLIQRGATDLERITWPARDPDRMRSQRLSGFGRRVYTIPNWIFQPNLSPDRTTLLQNDGPTRVQLRDFPSGRVRASIDVSPTGSRVLRSALLRPDGSILAAFDNGALEVWTPDGQLQRTTTVPSACDYLWLPSATRDGRLALVVVSDLPQTSLFTQARRVVTGLIRAPRPPSTISITTSELLLWDTTTGAIVSLPGEQTGIFSLNDKILATSNASGRITLWDLTRRPTPDTPQ